MENKKSNLSLFIYTGLIFIAAIAVIALSFFAQMNADKNHEKYVGEENSETSIAGKAAKLSEENRILLDTISSLNQKNSEITEDNEILTQQVLTLDKQMINAKKMYLIFDMIKHGKYDEASLEYETLEPLFFTEEQDMFYDYLATELMALMPTEETVQTETERIE